MRWLQHDTPSGMTRRHFLKHTAERIRPGSFVDGVRAFFASSRQRTEEESQVSDSALDEWWTIDDRPVGPKASAVTGGQFKPISTSGDVQICEHLPLLAKQFHNLSIVRSMSTREADHDRGRYYMHTGFVPNPSIEHPSYGAVVAHELASHSANLEIPPFVAVGGASEGPGFLGMSYAPFNVSSDGQIRNLEMAGMNDSRMVQRMKTLDLIEKNFVAQNRGSAAMDHMKVLEKTYQLMTSKQMEAFKVASEPEKVRERYGNTAFGRGCLMARRLVEVGVPFIEVDLGGWDNHQGIFNILQTQRLPQMDQAMSALVEDLEQRELLKDTAIIWMGEFGRTPTINGNTGRDHYARAWSVVVGGAGMKGGIAVGATDDEGRAVVTEPYSAEDLMASVCKSLGISLETTYQSKSGRPMKIANSGKVIRELFGETA